MAKLPIRVQGILNPNLAQFGAAIPAPDLLPSDRLNRILVRLVREGRVPPAVCGAPEGCLELRTQVARHAYSYSCPLDPSEVLITAGWLASLRILRQRPLEVLRDE